MGVALVPRLLIETELARGDLVIACNRPLRGERGYYIVTPERTDHPPALSAFIAWLVTLQTHQKQTLL
jgi:LysR family glycine cleavage system transcriptional activator